MKAYTVIALRPYLKVFVPVGAIAPVGVSQNHLSEVVAFSSFGNNPAYRFLRGWICYKPVTWREYFRNKDLRLMVA